MKIKICGLFRMDDIDFANEAQPDYIGFVFAESRRQVSPEQATRLRVRLRDDIVPVGVFVNTPVEEIAALYRDGIIDIAQLHGEEDREYIAALRKRTAGIKAGSEPVPVIKALRMDGGIPDTSSGADYLLLDHGSGGTGKAFDWTLLGKSGFRDSLSTPFFLAGGINGYNIEEAIRYEPFGIDVSGGAETNGVKDRDKMIKLVRKVRDHI